MSLYHETADLLTGTANAGGSLQTRIFNKKDLKSPPAQIYALAIETCKWSSVLKEIIEHADILRLERKLTPTLSLLLAHDLLLAKKGIALPATHGLRSSIEKHRARLQAEFTRARIRRKVSTVEGFQAFVEAGLENVVDGSEAPYPRWIRINTLRTTLEDQLETTFAKYERASSIDGVRQRGAKRVFVDGHIPNLVAVSPSADLSKSEAYRTGTIIFQDKASCFPAYLLDPLPEDGDIVDSCSAPGNKTTHLAAILLQHASEPDDCTQTIHAFERNKARAETLEKMVHLAGSHNLTKLHPGYDFLKVDPEAAAYQNVGALLLDPSCSGSGIVGRDDMPELHLPVLKKDKSDTRTQKKGNKPKATEPAKDSKKRKIEEVEELDVMVDDDGVVTAISTEDELKGRLAALSDFQTQLLVHAFKFPSARKITYSTCSIHAEENESVVRKALESATAKEKGWRLLKREEQVRGMRAWNLRGDKEACAGDEDLCQSVIRAKKGDEHATMGFFLAGFVRDLKLADDIDKMFLRDDKGHLVRDVMGIPVQSEQEFHAQNEDESIDTEITPVDEEWNGFGDDNGHEIHTDDAQATKPSKQVAKQRSSAMSRHSHNHLKKTPRLFDQKDKKRR